MERFAVSKKKISVKAADKSNVLGTDTGVKKVSRKVSALAAKTKAKGKKTNIVDKAKAVVPRKTSAMLKQEIDGLKTEIEILKDREANLKLELANKTRTNNNQIPATLLKEFADINDDIQRLKGDIFDIGNNIFHLHKVVKDASYSVENKMRRMLLCISLVVITTAVIVSFFVLYWQLNPGVDAS